ncbi:hypothetical protein AURDEDRAFT_130650 [Auricularia subglabra TFB-10046 SS5]|uniref:Uncharacterized protein n=1 Tax=Auricularia subglabra (strain TFB-10046 / SS5) TaxID=717982 RepID=J0WRM6_AURST|nr:hypothetical protein AURDEDRAFT_130650 [Auricularia subglabra TFB-10046 SS5]
MDPVLSPIHPVVQMDAFRGASMLDRTVNLPAELLVENFVLLPFWDHDLNKNNYSSLSGILVDHLPHVKALDLTLPRATPIPWSAANQMVYQVSLALRGDAPALESVRIVNHLQMDINGLSILEGPLLNTIELYRVDPSCLRKCYQSVTLRSLIVTTPDVTGFTHFDWPVFCSFPSLDTLGVRFTGPGIPDAHTRRCPFPRTLKRLALSLRPETLGQLTEPGDFSELDRWCISFADPALRAADFADVVPYLRTIIPVSAAIHFDSRLIHVMLTDASGCQGAVQALPFHPDWSHPFVRASRLCIGGLADLPSEVMGTATVFPSLEDLTLDVTQTSSAFTSNRFKWPRLVCSSLRTVRLWSATFTRHIPLEAVSSFLRDSLDAGPGKLGALVLDRVRISSARPDIDALPPLHAFAETVSVVDTGVTWPECHLNWNKSWDAILR